MKIKKFEELTIRDNFLFQKVMRRPDLCKRFLEKALFVKINRIIYADAEKTFKVSRESKSSRFDLYVELDDGTIVDVEIQTTGNAEKLSKRSRYYQGILDTDNLLEGKYYTELPRAYVIFLCTFDPFGENRLVYTFRNRCVESDGLELNDGATKIFFNTKGTIGDIDGELKKFLTYVDCGEINGDFVQDVANELEKVKQHKETRVEYMSWELEMQTLKRAVHEETLIDSVRSLMKNAQFTAEKAMEILEIPPQEREKILAAL